MAESSSKKLAERELQLEMKRLDFEAAAATDEHNVEMMAAVTERISALLGVVETLNDIRDRTEMIYKTGNSTKSSVEIGRQLDEDEIKLYKMSIKALMECIGDEVENGEQERDSLHQEIASLQSELAILRTERDGDCDRD